MSTTVSTLEGQDFLQPNGFKLVVLRKRFANLEFFAQSVSHPGVSVAPAIVAFRGTNLNTPGDKIEYDQLTVDAIVDENMNVYKEILAWMQHNVYEKISLPSNATAADQDLPIYDITLSVLSSHNNQVDKIVYKGAFPTNIGNINFQSTVDGVQYITFPITFAYTTFTITS